MNRSSKASAADRQPSCPLGYTRGDLHTILKPEEYLVFMRWLRGKPQAMCMGYEWDPKTGEYVASGCWEHTHGPIVYARDLDNYLNTNDASIACVEHKREGAS